MTLTAPLARPRVERALARERAHLARHVLRVAARSRAEHRAAADPMRCAVEPCRARPVPFCFHGFWLPPVTNFRILVAALPWR